MSTTRVRRGGVEEVSIAWTSDSSGDFTEAVQLYGTLRKIVTNPADASGDAPTDDYDITLIDKDGIDAMTTLGANRDTANSEVLYESSTGIPMLLSGVHTLTIAAAGDTKQGVVRLFMDYDT